MSEITEPAKGRPFSPACPLPGDARTRVVLGHGSGGLLTHELIRTVFRPRFSNASLDKGHDGAILRLRGLQGLRDGRIAFTTDSFVVRPLFFPGGDIGDLAVNGTVNDLAMCGARPEVLSAGFILEEGFETAALERIAESMKRAVERARVTLVTADTKVVERGKGDGLYVNTSGIGVVETPDETGPDRVRPGDAVILSGDVGRHGMAVMALRQGLEFESAIESDTAPVWDAVEALIRAGVRIRCLRDLTRGGLATALAEIAETAGLRIDVDETAIDVSDGVRGACELLGLDPLYVANEGRFAAFVHPDDADTALRSLAETAGPADHPPRRIGQVSGGTAGVVLKSVLGTRRVLDRLSGEQLPRIC